MPNRFSLLLRQAYSRFLNEPIDGVAPRSHCLRESDIFLASYPRSGNTWVRVILANLIMGPGKLKGLAQLDAVVPDIHQGIPRGAPPALPRIIKTHQPFAFRHEAHRPELYQRFIYVVRNPWDSIRSYHLFCRQTMPGFAMDLNAFARSVANGGFYPGSWNEHVLSWVELEGRNKLLVRYEELQAEPAAWIRRMAEFVGVGLDEASTNRIVEASSLKSMRELDMRQPLIPAHPDFVRERESGRGYKEEFTTETLELVRARSREGLKAAGYPAEA